MEEINQEIGLNALLLANGSDKNVVEKPDYEKERTDSHVEVDAKEKES